MIGGLDPSDAVSVVWDYIAAYQMLCSILDTNN
jgi:hypothetical protein